MIAKVKAPKCLKCAECGIKRRSGKKCKVCGSEEVLILTKKAPRPRAEMSPTLNQFTAYQAAWDYFNAQLFAGSLKPCLLVFREGRKTKAGTKSQGHFSPNRWRNAAGDSVHEISVNPELLYLDLIEIMDTLVHEMCHQWQQDHGKAPRACYHDRQWADKMLEVGLTPSDTGKPGGKMTGQSMGNYRTPGGAFEKAFGSMPAEVALPWVTGQAEAEEDEEEKPKAKNKVKYTCPGCESNVWGKSGMRIECVDCEEEFEELEA